MTYIESLNRSLRELLETRSEVVLFGEDILDPYGGAFKVTRGLQRDYPDRVLTTPISEGALAGIANGMALRGLRPVVEIMFADFLSLCMDQVFNHAAKFRVMYNGRTPVPVTIRTPIGGGRGYGPTHSQCPEKLFFGIPEIRVVAPSLFSDPGAVLRHAVLDDRPVLFLEHKLLYPAELIAGDAGLSVETVQDAGSPYPTSFVRNYATGQPDVTLIAYSGISRFLKPLLQRMREEEIRILACVPTLVKPLPFGALSRGVLESGKALIVEEGTGQWGWGAEIAARLQESLFGKLHAPVRRLAAWDTFIPAARHLEEMALPSAASIEEAILSLLQ